MVKQKVKWGVVKNAAGEWEVQAVGHEYYSDMTGRIYRSEKMAQFAERQSDRMSKQYAKRVAGLVTGVVAYDYAKNSSDIKSLRADDSGKYHDGLESLIAGIELAGGFNTSQQWYLGLHPSRAQGSDFVPKAIAMGAYQQYGNLTLVERNGAYYFYKANGASERGMSEFGKVLVYEGTEVQ